MATTRGSLNTTAFIVSLAIVFPVLILFDGVFVMGKSTGGCVFGEARHVPWHSIGKV